MSSDSICRWGILSTAVIGNKNWQAIKLSGNGQVTAVASRSLEKAQAFIDGNQARVPFDKPPQALGSYEELLARPDVDAIYIPLPTGMRHEWVIKAARAGKHVMCEKPCARNAVELQEMIDACKQAGVQFMDGVMYMHSSRLPLVRRALEDSPGIGKLKRIACQFSFCADEAFHEGNIRTNSDLEPQGCLGDLGWYALRFALWVKRYEMPVRVQAQMIQQFQRPDSPQPVPMEVESRLEFADGVTACCYNSFLTGHQQWAHISGTEGHVMVRDFVLPFAGDQLEFFAARPEFIEEGCDFRMVENRTDFSVEEPGNSGPQAQETQLFRRFAQCVTSGQLEPEWPEISLKTQRLLDACLASAQSGQPVELI